MNKKLLILIVIIPQIALVVLLARLVLAITDDISVKIR